jgi:hypothetical protein
LGGKGFQNLPSRRWRLPAVAMGWTERSCRKRREEQCAISIQDAGPVQSPLGIWKKFLPWAVYGRCRSSTHPSLGIMALQHHMASWAEWATRELVHRRTGSTEPLAKDRIPTSKYFIASILNLNKRVYEGY